MRVEDRSIQERTRRIILIQRIFVDGRRGTELRASRFCGHTEPNVVQVAVRVCDVCCALQVDDGPRACGNGGGHAVDHVDRHSARRLRRIVVESHDLVEALEAFICDVWHQWPIANDEHVDIGLVAQREQFAADGLIVTFEINLEPRLVEQQFTVPHVDWVNIRCRIQRNVKGPSRTRACRG